MPAVRPMYESDEPIEDRAPTPTSPMIAAAVTGNLGGRGLFGVELFVCGDQVWFSEVSPRPHDTGLVTLASQRLVYLRTIVRGEIYTSTKLSHH